MAKLFGIALLIVGPYGFVRIRRTLRETADRRAGADARGADADATDASAEGNSRSDVDRAAPPDDGVDVKELVAALERHRHDADRELVLVVPPDARVNGRPAPPGVARALLDDAARRSGIALTWTADGGGYVATAPATGSASD